VLIGNIIKMAGTLAVLIQASAGSALYTPLHEELADLDGLPRKEALLRPDDQGLLDSVVEQRKPDDQGRGTPLCLSESIDEQRNVYAILLDELDGVLHENEGLAKLQYSLKNLFLFGAPLEVHRNLTSGCAFRLWRILEILFGLMNGILGSIIATDIDGLGSNKLCATAHLVSRVLGAFASGASLSQSVLMEKRIAQYVHMGRADPQRSDRTMTNFKIEQRDVQTITQVASHVVQFVKPIKEELEDKDRTLLSIQQNLLNKSNGCTRCTSTLVFMIKIFAVLAGVGRAIMELTREDSISTRWATVAAYTLEATSAAIDTTGHNTETIANVRMAMITYIAMHFLWYLNRRERAEGILP
jgi:hypothetical protein